MIKTLFLYSLFVTLLLHATKRDCKLLPTGNYIMTYAYNSKESQSRLKIDNDNFEQISNFGDTTKGKLKWLYNCIVMLDYPQKENSDTTGLQYKLTKSFGRPCLELSALSKDTINFRTTYSGNLHITINQGLIVKVD